MRTVVAGSHLGHAALVPAMAWDAPSHTPLSALHTLPAGTNVHKLIFSPKAMLDHLGILNLQAEALTCPSMTDLKIKAVGSELSACSYHCTDSSY